ncbi:MAG TPA: FABP family protein, partial [Actinomycetota bacterium]|nr:FABP family protein [Actinomycetota bacterium]
APPLHENLSTLSFLLGTWKGRGEGNYPTIEPFSYAEEARFWHSGKPFLFYAQKTWSQRDGTPMHAESGFLRVGPQGVVELVLAHTFGIAEVSEGTQAGNRLELRSRSLAPTSSATQVEALRRSLEVSEGLLRYGVDMAVSGHELQRHLTAELALLES